MMISPSEGVLEGSLSTRIVLPLEFHALEELAVGGVSEPVVELPVESERAMRDELAAMERRLAVQAEEMEQRVEAARSAGRAEALETMGRECDERVALERGAVIKLSEQFAGERQRYFADVEAEVVRLALSIAARVLNREAAMDPLLLRGVVQVALDKVQDEGTMTLRVPQTLVEPWRGILGDCKVDVTVMGDAQLDGSECVLETNVGRVELGVQAQLQEIERGFFDLLARRPA